MEIVCPRCHEVVRIDHGYIASHGAKNHGRIELCSESGKLYINSVS